VKAGAVAATSVAVGHCALLADGPIETQAASTLARPAVSQTFPMVIMLVRDIAGFSVRRLRAPCRMIEKGRR
jgi:hypothetical protein